MSLTDNGAIQDAGGKITLRRALSGAALALGLVLGGTANATTSACNLFQTNAVNATGVTINSGCQIGDTNNPNTLADINATGYFSAGGPWTSVEPFASFVGEGTTSGTYDIGSNFFTLHGDALIVLKGGGTNTVPPFAIGYLLTATNGTTGTWYSPFLNSNEIQQNLSHALLFDRGTGHPGDISPVPLPAALPLLLAALGSLGVFGWFRRRATV